PALPRLLARIGPRSAVFTLGLLLSLLLVAAGMYALAEPGFLQETLAAPKVSRALAFSIAVIGSAGTAAMLAFRPQRAELGYAAIMAIFWIGVSILVYPRIDARRSGEAIIEAAARVLGPDETLGFAGWKEQFLLQWN